MSDLEAKRLRRDLEQRYAGYLELVEDHGPASLYETEQAFVDAMRLLKAAEGSR